MSSSVPPHLITDSRRVHPTVNPKVKLWADILPSSWKPYIQLARIDMISGSLLIFWPCTWSLLAAAYKVKIPTGEVLVQLPTYFFGSVLLHSIGCTWNDICDRKLDAQVEQTKHRPLASGTLSVKSALVFLLAQLVAFLLLLTQLRKQEVLNAMLFGLGAWYPIYPFMKRITHWPQAWLRMKI
ncbi:hypothetical protein Clacol_005724 [Clathrus columnatus]|uniref:Uncharacterized protein n=1 Tax=Clathrus columnatus TaxID=1419009 RepID=A0AAV5AA41_9AGAM|nr:hypothetical protein Clacol_005724 [Clathrus columnatus]